MTRVLISPECEPTFDNRCVCCNQTTNSHVTIVSRDLRYHIDFRKGWHALRAPACYSCGIGLHAWRIWYATRTLGSALVLFLLAIWLFPPLMPSWLAGLVFLLLFCLSIVAIGIHDHFYGPAVTVHNSRHLGVIGIEFRDPERAKEFRELNQEHLVAWPTKFDFEEDF